LELEAWSAHVVGSVVYFVPRGVIDEEKRLQKSNRNDHINECQDEAVWILREACQMTQIGLQIIRQEVPELATTKPELIRELDLSPEKLHLLRCAVQLLVDAFFMDEKSLENTGESMILLCGLQELLPRMEQNRLHDHLTFCALQFMCMFTTSTLIPLREKQQHLSSTLEMITNMIEGAQKNKCDIKLRARLLELRAYLQIQSDSNRCRSDLSAAIALSNSAETRGHLACMQLNEVLHERSAGNSTTPVMKRLAADFELVTAQSHLDDRSLHDNCFILAGLYSLMNCLDDGVAMYKKALSTEERFKYLYGEPRESQRAGLQKYMLEVCHESFGGPGRPHCLGFEGTKMDIATRTARSVAGKKVKPNDPCPCNSGKKWKKCCAQKEKGATPSTKPNDPCPCNSGKKWKKCCAKKEKGATPSTKPSHPVKAYLDLQKKGEKSTQMYQNLINTGTVGRIREQLNLQFQCSGTDVHKNAMDPFGDGDQSPLVNEDFQQNHRDIWCAGADVSACLQNMEDSISEFAAACIMGMPQRLLDIISKHPEDSRYELP